MKAAILTIGDEILSGNTINTNSSWISKTIESTGCQIICQLTVPDSKKHINNGLDQLFLYSLDLILCTGGLGPTKDDITRETLCDYFNTTSDFDKNYWQELKTRFKSIGHVIPESNRSQAFVPKVGKVFSNPIGSARGLWFEQGQVTLIALPGVPNEMKAMIMATVLPWMKERIIESIHVQTIRTTGSPESVLIEKINKIVETDHGCKIGYYPSSLGVDIRLTSRGKRAISQLKEKLCFALGTLVYAFGEKELEEIVVDSLKDSDQTISTAESCTGGLIGHRLTQVPGSSNVYCGGVIVYSDYAKMDLLNVKKSTLKIHGAVSSETAGEMSQAVMQRFKTSIGVSVTGISGPGGDTKNKPVGLVYAGLTDSNGNKTKKFIFNGDRDSNKLRSSQAVLNWIRLMIQNAK